MPDAHALPIPAFGYLRVSGKSQLDGDGFPRQRAAIEAYAAANGLEILRWFEERGVAGKTELENRPALQELFLALATHGVKTVIVERLDRLARDLMVQETIIHDMRAHGYTVVSTAEPDLCSDDPTRVLMRQIFGAIAQYDKSMIVAKLRAARERARISRGKCEGQKRYGELPGEQAVRDKILAERERGETLRAIAEKLNEEGIAPRRGWKWYASTVRSAAGLRVGP